MGILEIKTTVFEGPYDLLLSLIEEEKLNISELSISQVTEQYLLHLDTLEHARPGELADFLVVATKLLLLKSKLLLPSLVAEDDDGPSLEEQLKLYRSFVDASKKINELWLSDSQGSFRVEPPKHPEVFSAPSNLALFTLHESMLKLVERLTPPKAISATYIDKAVTLKEKIDFVRQMLKNKSRFTFNDLLKDGRSRTEIIVGFLALLELVKGREVGLSQSGTFGEIIIEKA